MIDDYLYIIYDLGDVGKEPMIRVLGTEPAHEVEMVLRIAARMRE